MKLNILLNFNKDILCNDINEHLHKLFSTLFIIILNKDRKKKNYSFYIFPKKTYFKNKSYEVLFSTNNELILAKLMENIKYTNDYFTLVSINEKNDEISPFLKVFSSNFLLNTGIIKNWKINHNSTIKSLHYRPEYGIDLLKELIEVQAYQHTSLSHITPNSKSKNGIEYYNFIDYIFVDEKSTNINLKGVYLMCHNLILKIKEDKTSKLLAREITHSGVGFRNSFGCGHTDYYNIHKGQLC